MRRAAPLRVVLAAVAGALLIAPDARAQFPIGIAEKLDVGGPPVGSVFTNPNWPALNSGRARLAVPWDVALLPKGSPDRDEFDGWVAATKATGVEPYVTFWYSRARHCGQPHPRPQYGDAPIYCKTPAPALYRRAFQAFRANPDYPHITLFSAWNEPNFLKRETVNGKVHAIQGFLTPKGKHWFHTVQLRGPQHGGDLRSRAAAAYYYNVIRQECPACTVVAGEFTSRTGPTTEAYWRAYRGALGPQQARQIWAIHPYSDVTRYQQTGLTDAQRTLGAVHPPLLGLGEGQRPRRADLADRGGRAHRRAGRQARRRPRRRDPPVQRDGVPQPARRRPDLGITRLYYYNFQSLGAPVQDFGLVDRANRPRTAFWRFAQPQRRALLRAKNLSRPPRSSGTPRSGAGRAPRGASPRCRRPHWPPRPRRA